MTETNKQEIITQAGICPFCGSDEIEYLETEFLCDGQLEYRCYCDSCGCYFSEYYKTQYTDTEIKRKGTTKPKE